MFHRLVLFEQALEEAAALDAEFASTKKLRGTLHGVPVSFKDLCKSYGRVYCFTFIYV